MNRVALALSAVLSTAVLAACGNSSETAAAPAELGAPTKEALEQGSPALTSAGEDVTRIAPKLEQYYFAKGYPRDLKGVKASMKPAGQKVSKGNRVAGYKFDEQAREFILCIQHKSGAWATYDTAPMAPGANGESGGCPADLAADGGGHSGH